MKKIFFIILTLFTCVTLSAKQDVQFRLNAPSAVVVGQQFRVEYTVNADAKDFRVGDFTGFDMLMGPSTSQNYSTVFSNGKRTSETSKTFTYILMAVSEGEFSMPAATIKVDGSQYSSNTTKVKVLPSDKSSQSQTGGTAGGGTTSASSSQQSSESGVGPNDVMVRLSLSKKKVYEGESILATIKLLTTNNRTQIQDFKLPNFDGFTVQEITLPDQKSYDLEHVNGRNYYTVVLKQYLLFPQKTGKIDIPAVTLDLLIPVRVQQRMRSLFDDFFDNYQNINKTVSSGVQSIESVALPFGKPASFMGGVGEYKISSEISTTEIKANEALTLKLIITGTGNIKFTKDPELKLPADFETFDPKVDVNIKATSSGVTGSKTIEYTMIPRFAGDFTIPAVEYSYFDTKDKTYKTLSTKSYEIKVEKGSATESTGSSVSNFSAANQEAVKMLGSDIRYIRTGNLDLTKDEEPIWGTFIYWLYYISSSLIFISFFYIYRKQAKENANIALMKTKKANKVAAKRLKSASKFLKEHNKEMFYDEMIKAIWGYLSDKLNMPLSVLNKDNIEVELRSKGVDDTLIKEFMDIMSTCEFAKYAPAQSDEAMDRIYDSTVSAINKMENIIRK